jgi:phosphoribosylglycinamide formyltransferase-1
MQAVLDACESGRLHVTPAVLICNNRDAAILDALVRHDAELVLLAGYMKKLGPRTLAHYRHRVLNIHPALLPRFGGQGKYGARVHEAVLAAGGQYTVNSTRF